MVREADLQDIVKSSDGPSKVSKRGRPPDSPQTSRRKLQAAKKKLLVTQQKVSRLEKSNARLSDALKDLEKKKVISHDCSEMLEVKFSGMALELFKNQAKNMDTQPKGRRYTDEVKKFAITSHFYSPHAYEHLRTIFTLPHPRSLRQWSSSVKCAPGFFKDVFKQLQDKVAKGDFVKDCALMLDSMHIKSRTQYNRSEDKFEGFVDFGQDLEIDHEKLATEALVFMLVGLSGRWKFPVGYFFCDKVDAEVQSRLVQLALDLAHEHGLKVHSVTCDCTNVNPKTLSLLGCQWLGDELLSNLDPSFTHGNEVHMVLDACHLLKLARNALAALKVMVDGQGWPIKWDHLLLLHQVQQQEGVRFANKLGARHTDFRQHVMKVNVAAQTFSSSVADALEFLMQARISGFEDATGTITFIRMIDRLFDFLNSRSKFGKGYKSPVFLHSLPFWTEVVSDTVTYLRELRTSSCTLVCNTPRRTFVRGFILTSTAVLKIAKNLLTCENAQEYVVTYKFSQDNLELLFRCIRGKGGFNNNPDTLQFRSSLRQLLLKNSIKCSKNANCLEQEVGECSSIFHFQWDSRRTEPLLTMATVDSGHSEDDEALQLSWQMQHFALSDLQKAIVGYVAGYIVRKLRQKLSCTECAAALSESINLSADQPHMQLILQKQRGGLITPSRAVWRLIEQCEKAFRVLVSGTASSAMEITGRKNIGLLLFSTVTRLQGMADFADLARHDLQTCTDNEELHSTQLKKKVCQHYITLRLLTYGQKYYTDKIQLSKVGKRQKLTKAILFENL